MIEVVYGYLFLGSNCIVTDGSFMLNNFLTFHEHNFFEWQKF